MLLGGPQNTIKSHLVFTALFCFAPFSVFSSRMSTPYLQTRNLHRLPLDCAAPHESVFGFCLARERRENIKLQ
jgi:hypothetical protein